MRNTLLSLLSILLFSSCSNGVKQQLINAETLMDSRPDSALHILHTINNRSIHNYSTKALHALLYSQALDKNWIDVDNDSLVRVAVDHYSCRHDYYRQFQSLYYHGRVRQNAKKYTQALLSYTQAEQLLNKIDTCYHTGLLYAQMGTIHYETFDYPKSLSMFQKAYLIYQKVGQESISNYTLYNIGKCKIATKEYADALQIFLQIKEWAEKNNQALYSNCCNMLLQIYENTGDYHSLKTLIDKDFSQLCSTNILALKTLSTQQYLIGNISKARSYTDSMWRYAQDCNDSIAILFHCYRLEKQANNYLSALKHYERVMHIQDSIVRYNLQQPLISAQRDFYQAEAEVSEYKYQLYKHTLIFALIVLLLSTITIYIYIRNKILERDLHIHRYINLSQELQREICQKNEQITTLSTRLNSTSNTINDMMTDINSLFSKQFALLDKLSRTYYDTHHTSRQKEAIYREVKAEIDHFCQTSKQFSDLEHIVNHYCENAMQILRTEVPLAESDYRLLCLLLAGFSAKTISVFTHDSTGNIYTKKHRLKQEIMRHNPTNCNKIIDMI